ncbi:conserved exported hypothetical protein [Candidatus Sulfopaludibacter sp. SbA3]|nr:conserved exported hypothetical protein [Candidatus Sulfopaludibacter sp. SbA3]
MRNRKTLLPVVCAVAALSLFTVARAVTYNPALWAGMRYRSIGPDRGGRVTAVTGVPSEPNTFYMGSTGGGVWKTTDAGHAWVNISDGQIPLGSMGAVEVSLSDPNVIYVGTGSSKIRSNVSIGRGIYKSTDAGRTWRFSGLRDSGQIATIRVDPANPGLVYVAAQGNPFVPNKERGVYRSSDGGKTWKNVLFVSDLAGAADLEIQPGNPKVLFACMWHAQRKPWTIISGAREGGIYKSTDGGDTWNKLGGGLPSELFGRANVAISAAAPNRIYALIEAKPGSGLYRSEDGGASWTLANGQGNLITRPFYYTTLGVDPTNADVVWVGDEGWFKSTDGGRSFRTSPVPHGDNHDVWINPRNSQIMIQGNDGGANVSLDGGRTWSTQLNQPTAEIYQVSVDNQYPYRVYGAQQDDNTVIVPGLPLGDGQGFRNGPGCETGPIMPDKDNPVIVYGGCKGQFSRLNLATTNEQRYWVGAESLYGNGGDTLMYRFQRVSPMEVSPYTPHTVYYGSQYLHRSYDGGVTWQKISPDLTAHPEGTQGASGEPITRDATGEEVYSTLYAIRESPLQKGLIWTGSNDGPVYVTRDDAKTWTNVTPKDLPPGGRIQNIEPSPHKPGTAYVAAYRFLLGDFAPYLFRTDDFGKTWTRLTDGKNGIAADEPTRVVREDPDRAGLLYAGTEFGIYISYDNGAQWQSFQMNLPNTPVTDIKVAHKDLILSTQGRGFWVLDNLTPIHQLPELPTTAGNHLFTPRDAIRTTGGGRGGRGGLQPGAQIDYAVSEGAGDIKLEFLDASGKVVRTISSAAQAVDSAPADFAPADDEEGGGGGRGRGFVARLDKNPGAHRFTWDLRYPGPWASAARPEGPNGPEAVPGKYSVRLTVGSWTATKPLTIVEDPRIVKDGVTEADLKEQLEHNLKVRDLVSDVNKLVARLRVAQASVKDPAKLASLKDLSADLITPAIRYSKPQLQTHITYLYTVTNSTDQKIGRDVIERYQVLRKALDQRIQQLNEILK